MLLRLKTKVFPSGELCLSDAGERSQRRHSVRGKPNVRFRCHDKLKSIKDQTFVVQRRHTQLNAFHISPSIQAETSLASISHEQLFSFAELENESSSKPFLETRFALYKAKRMNS